MPDDRLQRTREAYRLTCNHRSQMSSQFRTFTDTHGKTHHERIPQRFRVRGADAWYCPICGQFVDAEDEREALNAS